MAKIPAPYARVMEPLDNYQHKHINGTTEKHEVTFDSDGGTPIESQLVEDGTTASIPVEPKKEGHSFLYWSYNNEEFDLICKYLKIRYDKLNK